MAPWCEHCRDHVAFDHYDDDGWHGIGDEYGPHGALLAEAAQARELRAEVERLHAAGDELARAVALATAPGRTHKHALHSLPAALQRYRENAS